MSKRPPRRRPTPRQDTPSWWSYLRWQPMVICSAVMTLLTLGGLSLSGAPSLREWGVLLFLTGLFAVFIGYLAYEIRVMNPPDPRIYNDNIKPEFRRDPHARFKQWAASLMGSGGLAIVCGLGLYVILTR